MAQHDPARRRFLGGVAALTAGGWLVRTVEAVAASPSDLAAAGLSEPERYLWRMLEGVPIGEPFWGAWVLVDAYPPIAGGLTLVVAKGVEGRPLRVDVVRRAEPPRAAAYTDHLELYTMDGGGGVRVMPHDLVEALQHLALLLHDNQAQHQLALRLLTHPERVARYPQLMEKAATELAPVLPELAPRVPAR